MGCRNAERGEAARKKILEDVQKDIPVSNAINAEMQTALDERLILRAIDLAALRSVRTFVEGLEREGTLKRLDLLILNAAQTGAFSLLKIILVIHFNRE